MQNEFLNLKDDYIDDKDKNIFDDVEIITDPDLEDESTVDINNYMNKFILQCRICGNLFPSKELLDDDSTCPICDSKSPNGFKYKGKLKYKNNKKKTLDDENNIIENEFNNNYKSDSKHIFTQGEFKKYRKDDLSDNETI